MSDSTSYVCHVHPAADITVTAGVNTGDTLGAPADLCLGDVYELSDRCRALRLSLCEASGTGGLFGAARAAATVAEGSEAGGAGDRLHLESRLTFMAPDGSKAELLALLLSPSSSSPGRWFLPLTPLEPGLDYTLIDVLSDPPPVPLTDVTSVAFARGTRITLADGTQCPIERLRPGDLVLTRDSGPQPLRHVLARTVRAVGAFAPVAIARGALGNADDLIVSQHQRLFLYRRGPDRLVERAETLVKAGDLVDGDAVTLRKGGYCDYMSPVFDRHEVIYAECIPVESLLVNEITRRGMPVEDRAALDATLPDLAQTPLRASEAPSSAIERARTRLLRRRPR